MMQPATGVGRDAIIKQSPTVVLFANSRAAFAVATFNVLLELSRRGSIHLTGIVGTEERAAWRGKLRSVLRRVVTGRAPRESLGKIAARAGVQVVLPKAHDINQPEVRAFLQESRAEIVVVFGCDQILREALLRSGPVFINYHNSLLPKYRGVAANIWPYLEHERVSGFSYHTIEDERIDQGKLVLQGKVAMPDIAHAGTYQDLLNDAAARALPDVIRTLVTGCELPKLPRDGPYYSRRKFELATRADRLLTVDDAYTRAAAIGHLVVQCGPLVLRLHQPSRKRDRWSDVAIAFSDGKLWFSKVNYLPAIFFAPLLHIARSRQRSVHT